MVWSQTGQVIGHQLCPVQKMHMFGKIHHLHVGYSATMDAASTTLVGTGEMNLMHMDVYEDRRRDLDWGW